MYKVKVKQWEETLMNFKDLICYQIDGHLLKIFDGKWMTIELSRGAEVWWDGNLKSIIWVSRYTAVLKQKTLKRLQKV